LVKAVEMASGGLAVNTAAAGQTAEQTSEIQKVKVGG